MLFVIWRANAGRRYPQTSAVSNSISYGGSGSVEGSRAYLRNPLTSVNPFIRWPSLFTVTPGTGLLGDGALSPSLATSGSVVLDHYDMGTETDVLYLVSGLTVDAFVGTRTASGTMSLSPLLSGDSVISRQGTGNLVLVTTLSGAAHTEGDGNKSAIGAFTRGTVFSGTGTLQHPTPFIPLTSVPYLTVEALVGRDAVGNLVLSPFLSTVPVNTSVGNLRLEARLSGTGEVRVQSGLWIILPEDTRGWTTR